MVKDVGDLGEVANGVVGSKPTTLPQGVAEQSGLLGVRDQDLVPSHGPLLEGLSPHHLDVAWRTRPRGVEAETLRS